ncbi:hypothetical protein AXYL_00089 [Achromobacter xylosoxidans A8]|uniref:Uncharacterized protein n=1 Tax=Achromobacter xylosoxidans (strain A8) TaxID=762376 RepID=E3HN38_ACHXA|nr:hypothetical protein [Achromobacter xylosoxidans]ADP13451.1 hypothetical protein AXYL_00089 [Achromobacter xylosoxidans A8]
MMSIPVPARLCLMTALLAPALTLAQPSVDADLAARAAAQMERHRANVDDLLSTVRREGMALLVIPTINLDAAPQRDFDNEATRDRYVRQRSTFMRWNHKSEKDYAISAGQGEHKLDMVDVGPQFQTVRGKLLYQVIPVWPGEYWLNRITYHQPRTELPETVPSQSATERLKKIGIATLDYAVDREFKKTSTRPQSEPEADDGLGQGCEVVLRVGGGCDEAARELRWRISAERAFNEGWADAVPAPGIDVELSFSPIAAIKLEAGEVVLTDGFVLPLDQPVMTPDSCEGVAFDPVCTMDSITLTRLPASLEDFRQAPDAGSFKLPKLDEALRDLVYRAPTLYYKPESAAAPNLIRAE